MITYLNTTIETYTWLCNRPWFNPITMYVCIHVNISLCNNACIYMNYIQFISI